MKTRLLITSATAALAFGAAIAGTAQAQDVRGRGPIIIVPPGAQQQMPNFGQMPRFQVPQRGPQAQPPVPQQQQAQAQRDQGNLNSLLDAFDGNKDGTLTQDEIDKARSDRLKQFDKDGDGKLSIEEYSALWLDAMHRDMVRQFQGHDTDGDGKVTVEEFDARYKDAVKRADTNNDGKLTTDDVRRPVAQQAPQQQRQIPQPQQRQVPQQQRRGAPTNAPGGLEAAPGQAI